MKPRLLNLFVIMTLGLFLWQGCATPPFSPSTDIRISSIASANGGDEITPDSTLLQGGSFPYLPATIQFSINNGVGVDITDLEIDYSAAEGDTIAYVDSNGNPQTGIPAQKTKIQRHFNATIPFTELPQSGAASQTAGVNVGDGQSRVCCIFVNLVTNKAFEVLSVDGSLLTEPNYNANIIANLTIRGVDDNENGFVRKASIAVSTRPAPIQGIAENACDPACSIGTAPSDTASGGGTDAGSDTGSTGGTDTTTGA